MPIAWTLAHGTIAATATPMLCVAKHVSPIVTESKLLVGLKCPQMSSHRMVMGPGMDFVA